MSMTNSKMSVCFQIDTDNRENFPSAVAFNNFRKQRDSFYEILKIWEENHSVRGWTFQVALAGKIRTMLTLYNDATNYSHFAGLFKSQLLISCIHNGHQEEAADDDSLSFLKTLKHTNPEKLTQLRKRLVAPLPCQSSIQSPSFPGAQEFFKDFILHAFNPIFYAHLENCLVHEIMELNKTQFIGSEIEDSETTADEQTQQNFITCLSSLRLLAKVLGLLVSLPYRLETGASKQIVNSQIDVRSSVVPSLNLHNCLHSSLTQGKLSLTIPWIVKYLAMMDIVCLRLPYYKQILELLYYIYQTVNHYDFSTSDSLMSQRTALLLKSTLSWLIELPNFPKDLCHVWQESYKVRELKSLQQLINISIEKCIALCGVEPFISDKPVKYRVDKLDIISDRVMRTCCPVLSDLQKVSASLGQNAKYNCGSPNKHITPVSSQLHKSTTVVNKKHLELQLEEAFFHGQPASTRKTVDFVSERVASTCVKYICNNLLASARESNLLAFRELVKERQKKCVEVSIIANNGVDSNEFKSLLMHAISTLATNAWKNLKEQCEKSIPAICRTRITKSIESLLAEDSLEAVKEMCIKIATRLAIERINQWIQSHIVGGSLFVKDMELEINRFLRNSNSIHLTQRKRHDPSAPSPTAVINEIRSLMWELLDNGGKSISICSVCSALDALYRTLTERVDLLSGPEKMLYSLSVDLALTLIAYRMDVFTQQVQKEIIRVWNIDRFRVFEAESPMLRLLSPRNVMLLAQPENDAIWSIYGKFLRQLLNEDILTIDILSDQCVALFRYDWPVPVLKRLSTCLNECIDDYRTTNEKAEKVRCLLGWIAETCREMEIGDDIPLID